MTKPKRFVSNVSIRCPSCEIVCAEHKLTAQNDHLTDSTPTVWVVDDRGNCGGSIHTTGFQICTSCDMKFMWRYVVTMEPVVTCEAQKWWVADAEEDL